MSIARLFLSIFSALSVSCADQNAAKADSSFDKLCAIYERVVTQDTPSALKGTTLSENIRNELPEFYEKHYQHLVNVDRVDRYAMIKKIAENETSKEWNCAIMKSYLKGELDK